MVELVWRSGRQLLLLEEIGAGEQPAPVDFDLGSRGTEPALSKIGAINSRRPAARIWLYSHLEVNSIKAICGVAARGSVPVSLTTWQSLNVTAARITALFRAKSYYWVDPSGASSRYVAGCRRGQEQNA
jgi:hypothetical protein